VNHIN